MDNQDEASVGRILKKFSKILADVGDRTVRIENEMSRLQNENADLRKENVSLKRKINSITGKSSLRSLFEEFE